MACLDINLDNRIEATNMKLTKKENPIDGVLNPFLLFRAAEQQSLEDVISAPITRHQQSRELSLFWQQYRPDYDTLEQLAASSPLTCVNVSPTNSQNKHQCMARGRAYFFRHSDVNKLREQLRCYTAQILGCGEILESSVVSKSHDTNVRNGCWEQVTEPHNATFLVRPCFHAVTIEAVNSYEAKLPYVSFGRVAGAAVYIAHSKAVKIAEV